MQPVIVWDQAGGMRLLQMMFWRFLPPSVTDPKKFRLDTINAKGETLLDSNVWRYAFLHNRCLIPIDSFVEWRHVDAKTKLPWLFGMKDGEPFALAGVYRHWRSPDGKSGMDTFAIQVRIMRWMVSSFTATENSPTSSPGRFRCLECRNCPRGAYWDRKHARDHSIARDTP
jgi:hypothetical protein